MNQDKFVFISTMLITCIFMCLFLVACKKEKASDHAELDFQSLNLVRRGTTNESNIYNVTKTEKGLYMENCLLSSYFDQEKQQEIETKYICNSMQGSDETYHQLAQLLNDLKIKKWNGFKGSNPYVLDGDSFSFKCVLKDGTTITACGTNAQPPNLNRLSSTLYDLINRRSVSETNFSGHNYSCLLPKNWIGPIEAVFGPYYISFVSKIDDRDVTFLTIEDTYSEIQSINKNSLKAGKLEVLDCNDIYIGIRKNQYLANYLPKMDESQKAIYQNLDNDIPKIIDSLKGTNNYNFVKYTPNSEL